MIIDPKTGKKIVLVDPSALKSSGCCLAMNYNIIQGYRKPVNSCDIEFGSAFHLYRKLKVETGDEFMALAKAQAYYRDIPKYMKPKKMHLDTNYLAAVCEGYDERYSFDEYGVVKDDKGKPLVELRLVFPYKTYDDLDVLFCGTVDEICYNPIADFYCIKDYKTTSVWDIRGYLGAYRLSSQLMSYKFILQNYARLFPGSVISKVCERPLGAFIDGVFLGASKTTYERSDVFFYADSQMAEFEKGLAKAVEEIVWYVRNPGDLYRQGMMNSSCEKVYGACQFFEACVESEPENRQSILDTDFIKKPYDPRTHGATP